MRGPGERSAPEAESPWLGLEYIFHAISSFCVRYMHVFVYHKNILERDEMTEQFLLKMEFVTTFCLTLHKTSVATAL